MVHQFVSDADKSLLLGRVCLRIGVTLYIAPLHQVVQLLVYLVAGDDGVELLVYLLCNLHLGLNIAGSLCVGNQALDVGEV